MVKSKESPKNRRKSIAVPTHKKPVHQRKRPHSIAPGDTVLSPRALARRVLVPRKSILKSSINVVEGDEFTQTLDFTRDYRSAPRKSLGRRVSFAQHAYVKVFERDIRSPQQSSPTKEDSSPQQEEQEESPPKVNDENDYPGAKPIPRRRSSVRRSFGDASEMPSSDMELDFGVDGPSAFLGQGQSQDDFGVGDYDDEVWDDEEDEFDDGEDMEITEAIANNIRRRSIRRSSIARPPLAEQQEQQQEQQPSQDPDYSQSYEEEPSTHSQASGEGEGNSQSFISEGTSTTSEPMEYTVPLSQPVRGKRPPSDAFLALRAMTHASENSYEEEPLSDDDGDLYVRKDGGEGEFDGDYWDEVDDLEPEMEGSDNMELTDAIQRLKVARESLGKTGGGGGVGEVDEPQLEEDWVQQDDSFTDEDEEGDSEDMGNQTLNLTGLVRRASMGQVDIGMPDAEIGASAERQENAQVAPPSTAGKENEHPPLPPQEAAPTTDSDSALFKPPTRANVFSGSSPFKPSRSTSGSAAAPIVTIVPLTVSKPFVFSKPGSELSQAQADTTPAQVASDPVPSTPKPRPHHPSSPGKSRIPVPQPTSVSKPAAPKFTAAFAPPSARKLPRARSSENLNETLDPEDRPSPAKKLKALPVFQNQSPARPSPQRTVGRLSPSKKAKFENPSAAATNGSQEETVARRASVGLRRPPGYLAQRRSMSAPGVNANRDVSGGMSVEKKAAMAKLGRASVGSAGNVSLGVFDPRAEAEAARPSSPATKDDGCEREKARQDAAMPSPTRGSPSPASLDRGRMSPVAVTVDSHAYPPSIYPKLPGSRQGSPVLGRASPRPASPSPGPLYPPLPKDSPAREDPPVIVDVTYGEEDMPANPTEQWVRMVQDAGSFEEDDEPPISIEQFFSMTGIKFMDELTVPRRSTFHRAGIQARGRRDSATSETGEDATIPLAEYIVATAVDFPQLELYSHVARDLQDWIQHSKENFKQAELECAKVAPELFREYLRCNEEDRPDFQQSLKLIKSHVHDQAKSKWYEWKLEWIKQLQGTADQGFTELEADAKVLESLTRQVQDILPSLREEYKQALSELEQEQAEVDELERSDQSYLNELKATIAEQDLALESFRTDISENKAKLTNFTEKLEEIEQEKKELLQAIADAERMANIQKNSTKAEVFKLRDELESIQSLHYWRSSKLRPDLIELIYDSCYLVSIPCTKFKPKRQELIVTRLAGPSTRRRDDFSKLTDYSFKVGMHQVMTDRKIANVRQIVHRLSDIWASCAQLRQQLTFVGIKFPTSVSIKASEGGKPPQVNVVATILYPGKRAKVLVKFMLDVDAFASWPKSIASLRCDVEVVYGSIEPGPILEAVRGRLSKATPADNHGCLLDACILGMEQYN
ncbi:hypothetical protein NEOLEDRAFT_1179833 [Neolentinus lepideus HHB14362 ss-1]|uniref:Spc7 kinetochore protein domain-containing protein n=1 Tax=Neolentinus lepideus HHB14362 ss-1 TaxID=1314782 RepID=A0A165RIA0_9AGAM|nr:hypothetical protein NEOLEDRAFT_1179833 [Neolentinus lepideus HHB14362 ss-1]